MKFELGQWFLLPDVEAIYPRSVTNVLVEDDALIMQGYNHDIHTRSSYIHGALITARFSSPIPDVIRVQLWHHKGLKAHTPAFNLDYSLHNPDAEIGCTGEMAWLKTGNLSVHVPTSGEWQFSFLRNNQPLTGSGHKGVGLFTKDGKTYLRDQLSIGVGETIYGLGERFGAFVKNGQSFDMWNDDAGTLSEYAYKNVPFYVSNKGYGVLVNHPGKVAYEVASHHVSRVQFSTEGQSLDYYIFAGADMKNRWHCILRSVVVRQNCLNGHTVCGFQLRLRPITTKLTSWQISNAWKRKVFPSAFFILIVSGCAS